MRDSIVGVVRETLPLRCQGDPVGGLIFNHVHLFIMSFDLLSCEELQPITAYTESMTAKQLCDVALALPFLAWFLFVSVLLISSWCVSHPAEVGAPDARAPLL